MEKRSEIKNFTEGNLTSHIIKFAIPVLLSHLMMVLLNTVDMVVVGYKLGEAGTSAVSIGGTVAMFLNAFIGGFSAAAQIIIAMLVGVGEKKKISKFVSTACGFIFVLAVGSMLLLIPLTGTILNLLNTPPEAYAGAYEYSIICLFGIIPIYAYHIISSIVRGMGNSKHPLVFITIACGLNIILDLVFVLWADMGVGGAALATVIAQLVSVIFSIVFLIKKRESFELSIEPRDFVKWDKSNLSRFVRLAIPMAINNSAIQIANMVITSQINGFGVSVSAFSGIRANIATTVDLILGSLAAAGAMVIGQNIAAGKFKRVNGVLIRVGIISASVATALVIAFLIFPNQLFGIFTKDTSVLSMVLPYLPILMLSFVFAGIRPVTRSIIEGSGNRRINLIIALLDAIVARIGFAFLFGVVLGFGYMGFWFGITLAEIVPILIGIVFYLTGAWKKHAKIKSKEDT